MGEVLFSDAVSKVSIDAGKLQSPLLSRKRKHELRVEILKDYITRKPYGTRIKTQEFQKLLHFKTDANAWAFIEKTVKQGTIVKHELSIRRFFYTVPGETHITKPVTAGPPPAEEKPEVDQIIGERQYSIAQLNNEAMKYFWAYDDTSIKGFINWLKSQE